MLKVNVVKRATKRDQSLTDHICVKKKQATMSMVMWTFPRMWRRVLHAASFAGSRSTAASGLFRRQNAADRRTTAGSRTNTLSRTAEQAPTVLSRAT